MTAIPHRLSVAPTVKVRRPPAAPSCPRRAVPAAPRVAPRPLDAGWGYPPPSAYPQAPVPPWAALAPAGLAGPAGPLADPIHVTGPTALDDLLRRWLP